MNIIQTSKPKFAVRFSNTDNLAEHMRRNHMHLQIQSRKKQVSETLEKSGAWL